MSDVTIQLTVIRNYLHVRIRICNKTSDTNLDQDVDPVLNKYFFLIENNIEFIDLNI